MGEINWLNNGGNLQSEQWEDTWAFPLQMLNWWVFSRRDQEMILMGGKSSFLQNDLVENHHFSPNDDLKNNIEMSGLLKHILQYKIHMFCLVIVQLVFCKFLTFSDVFVNG